MYAVNNTGTSQISLIVMLSTSLHKVCTHLMFTDNKNFSSLWILIDSYTKFQLSELTIYHNVDTLDIGLSNCTLFIEQWAKSMYLITIYIAEASL